MLGAVTYPRIFGTKNAGAVIGFANASGSVGAMLGAPIAGFILDTTGSYSLFMVIASVLVGLCVIFTFTGVSLKKKSPEISL
jgi:nitrate/nitrite transporter NarK